MFRSSGLRSRAQRVWLSHAPVSVRRAQALTEPRRNTPATSHLQKYAQSTTPISDQQRIRTETTNPAFTAYHQPHHEHPPTPPTLLERFIDKHGRDGITASVNYNRWLVVPTAVCTHVCLGGVYSWSLFNGPLTREIGCVASVAADWGLSQVVPVFSTVILFNGVAGALLGKWCDRVGPRIALGVGGALYGGGIMIGSIGIATHSLPLLYLGYGWLFILSSSTRWGGFCSLSRAGPSPLIYNCAQAV